VKQRHFPPRVFGAIEVDIDADLAALCRTEYRPRRVGDTLVLTPPGSAGRCADQAVTFSG
jgi:hypothetical protein